MNQEYYEAVTKMEEMGVDAEYIQGWQGAHNAPCITGIAGIRKAG